MRSFNFIIAILCLGSFTAVAQHDRPWEDLACTNGNIQSANSFVKYIELRVEAAREFKQKCAGSGGSNSVEVQCRQFLVGVNHGANAVAFCRGIDEVPELACFENVVGRNFYPGNARVLCVGSTKGSWTCMEHLLDRGHATNSKAFCAGLSVAQAECVINLVDQGYNPANARRTCM